MSQTIMKSQEKIAFSLRKLYETYGYLPYKMGKFEEYDLYVSNKEFLVGDGVITFNDTNGKLLALKPDVTLSIIKNDGEGEGNRKVYYNENVYRISAKTGQFKEIMQVGLECIGNIGVYDVYETVCLAAGSLAAISENYVLDISHQGLLNEALAEIDGGESFSKEVLQAIAQKNSHETCALCEKYAISQVAKEKLLALIEAYGEPSATLAVLEPYFANGKTAKAFTALKQLCGLLADTVYADKIRLDFSVVNDRNYYDDIVFKGFIDGVAEGVLSGGRYDKLMARMGKTKGAIGFAVYLDLLESFNQQKSAVDVDVLLLYDDKTDLNVIIKTVKELTSDGKSVRAEKNKGDVRYGEILDVRGKGV